MMSSILRPRAAWTAALALLWPLGAQAVWEAVPYIRIIGAAEENPRLDVSGEAVDDTTSSSVVDAGATLSTFNQRGFITFEPRVRSNVYRDDAFDDLDGDDWFLNGEAEYRWQLVSVGFRSDYRKRAIIRSELVEIDDPEFEDRPELDDPEDVDSGRLTFTNQDQELFTILPYLDFTLSPRSTIRLQAMSTNVSYSGGNLDERTGFDDTSLMASVIRRVNERSTVSARLIVSEYTAEANNNSTDTVGVEGDIRRAVTDLWTVNVTAGVRRSDFVFDEQQQQFDNAAADFTFALRASRRSERSRLDLRFQRNLNPNASGFLVQRDSFRAYLNHDLTQRLSTRFGIRVHQTVSVGETAPENDRDYQRAEISFDWALRPRWSLTAGYNYTSQRFTREDRRDRDSSRIFIGIGYRGIGRPGGP